MIVKTQLDCAVPSETLAKYFSVLVGKVFKILPLAEESIYSAKVYLDGLMMELRGFDTLFDFVNDDPLFISFLSIIAFLQENIDSEQCNLAIIKREVFQAISICQKLEAQTLTSISQSGGDDE
jgi:hypothetical protein